MSPRIHAIGIVVSDPNRTVAFNRALGYVVPGPGEGGHPEVDLYAPLGDA